MKNCSIDLTSELSEEEIYSVINKLENIVIKHPAYVEAEKKLLSCFEKSLKYGICHHTSCWGQPGTGKSTLRKAMMKRFPKIELEDRMLQHVVSVITPPSPTKKRLAEEVLKVMGDECYFIGAEAEKTQRIERLFESLDVKMIIFDELQHFVDQNNRKILWEVTDWLKHLEENTNVCIVLLGLQRGKLVIDKNSQLSRRFSRHIALPPFSVSTLEGKSYFASVLHKILRIPPVTISVEDLTEDFFLRFFYATEGIIDYMIKLICAAFELAALAKDPVVTMKHLQLTFADVVLASATEEQNPFSKSYKYIRLVEEGMPFHEWIRDADVKRIDKMKLK